MKEFWKNEWDLFKQDINEAVNFLTQPVDITVGGKKLMLKPAVEEVAEKSEQRGFWANQWELFNKDCEAIANFLTKPINFK